MLCYAAGMLTYEIFSSMPVPGYRRPGAKFQTGLSMAHLVHLLVLHLILPLTLVLKVQAGICPGGMSEGLTHQTPDTILNFPARHRCTSFLNPHTYAVCPFDALCQSFSFPQLQTCYVNVTCMDLKWNKSLLDSFSLTLERAVQLLMYVCAGIAEWSPGNKESDFRETRARFKEENHSPQLIELFLKEKQH